MHFLMPHVFESHRDFKEWFSNPMSGMVEGNSEYNDSLIKRCVCLFCVSDSFMFPLKFEFIFCPTIFAFFAPDS